MLDLGHDVLSLDVGELQFEEDGALVFEIFTKVCEQIADLFAIEGILEKKVELALVDFILALNFIYLLDRFVMVRFGTWDFK